jgi:hypothetical protein
MRNDLVRLFIVTERRGQEYWVLARQLKGDGTVVVAEAGPFRDKATADRHGAEFSRRVRKQAEAAGIIARRN